MVYVYNGLLLSDKKRQAMNDTCNTMAESQKHYVKSEKPDKNNTYCVIPLIWNPGKYKAIVTENGLVLLGAGVGEWDWLYRVEIVYILIVVVVTWQYPSVKS